MATACSRKKPREHGTHDGPAAIMRIVLDVSQVEDANVSNGFGSAYFSTTGPIGRNDIRIATLQTETGSTADVDAMTTFDGYFYVNGD